MTKKTRISLNLLQKIGLDYWLIRLVNNRFVNPILLTHGWDVQTAEIYHQQYEIWKDKLVEVGVTFKGKDILEIGAGGSIGLGYFFFDNNYRSWWSSDSYLDLKNDKRLIKKEKVLLLEIEKKYNLSSKKLAHIENDKIYFNPKIDFIKLDLENLNPKLENSFDVIFSTAVLEHIDVEEMFKSSANLIKYLRPGGVMLHEIDLRDHINVANPFSFYRYGKGEWNDLTKGSIFYTNRLRASDYKKIFKANNFTELRSWQEQQELNPLAKISRDFVGYSADDLSTTRLFTIWQKK